MTASPPDPQSPPAAPAGRVRRLAGAVRRHPWRTVLALPALLLLYILVLVPFTPGVSDLRRIKSGTPSVVMSSDGVVLAEFKRGDRQWVPLEKIAPSVVDALIATEDRRFYDHHGIDFQRTAGALLSTLSGDLQGGSTITQQLARNLYADRIGRDVTLTRKVREAITAIKIEAVYSKREILETYLNSVPFLYNAVGIEMAARTYFDKPAERLTVQEAAMLVGMLKATSALNPVRNPERARSRRNLVLEQMAKAGKLSQTELAELSARPLHLKFERQTVPPTPMPHIVRHLQDWLIDWAGERDRNLYFDGLVIRTTIDSRMQAAANKAVTQQLNRLQPLSPRAQGQPQKHPSPRAAGRGAGVRGNKHTLQAGFLALDPRNGHVRAWVGSRDFSTEEFDHVSQARRQPGSAFKPFVYAAAFTAGLRANSTAMDAPVKIPLEGGGYWEPKDVSPPSHHAMTLHDALVYSKNTITAQVVQYAGPRRVANLAWSMGVRSSRLDPVPSIALGTSPVTLREMVAAYGTIANGGRYVEPMIVTRIEDHEGRVLAQFGTYEEPVPVLGPQHVQELIDALRDAVTRGTGAAIKRRYGITADVAGKTGTTQENTDGWFILMHPELVAGARVGFNEQLTMGPWGAGARSALPIVGEVFQQAQRKEWIDANAQFGSTWAASSATERYAKGLQEASRDGSRVREFLADLREHVRGLLP